MATSKLNKIIENDAESLIKFCEDRIAYWSRYSDKTSVLFVSKLKKEINRLSKK